MSTLLLLSLAGCQGLFDPTRVWVEGAETARQGPVRLVAGSTITVTFNRRFSRTLLGSTITSTAPATLSVGPHTPTEDTVEALLSATAPGDALLQLVRDGEPLGSLAVEVRAPDRFALHPVGPRLFQGVLQDAEARPSLLEGGGARFLVTWYAGEAPLEGRGAIAAPEQPGLEVLARAGDRDTLQHDSVVVRSVPAASSDTSAPAPVALHVTAGGVPLDHPLRLRQPEEVVGLRLDGPSFQDNWLFDQGFVLAQGVDAAGEVVHGAPVTWQWGQEAFPGEGEVFRYMAGSDARTLRAAFAGHSAEVEASGTGGTVLDVTRACATAPGAGWLGVAVGIGALARRRAARGEAA